MQILKTIETARPNIKFAINEQLLGGVRMATIAMQADSYTLIGLDRYPRHTSYRRCPRRCQRCRCYPLRRNWRSCSSNTSALRHISMLTTFVGMGNRRRSSRTRSSPPPQRTRDLRKPTTLLLRLSISRLTISPQRICLSRRQLYRRARTDWWSILW